MRRWLLLAAVLAQEPIVTKARLERETSVDYRSIQHYTVILPEGRITLSGDGDLPFMQQLRQYDGVKVRVRIEKDEPARLER